MKKMIILILFSILTLRLTAPEVKELVILKSEPEYIYNVKDPFLRAVISYESNYQERAVNPITKARGILQILPIMVREVNKYSENKYIWDDCFDPVKSIEIWDIIMQAKNPDYCYDRACRLWFGTGTQHDGKTWEDYYTEVMKLI